MLLSHTDAMSFIDGYKAVLLEVLKASKIKRSKEVFHTGVAASVEATSNVELSSSAGLLTSTKKKGRPPKQPAQAQERSREN